jgi:ketosteroid isomerase-like protein
MSAPMSAPGSVARPTADPTARTTDDPTADLAARVQRLEDLHAIGQLRAHYCQALDDGRWDDLLDLFTPDGAFVGLFTARGHAELRTFFAELQDGPLSAWWHFSSNETIDLVGSPAHAATGQTWLDQPCVVDGRAHVAAGRYQDRMVRGDDGRWRFAERRVTFFYWVPTDEDWAPGRYGWAPARAAADARTLERTDSQGG